MKILKATATLVLTVLSVVAQSQINPSLKKYAGAYHRLNFGEEVPTATTEKITLLADGNWSSTRFPTDANGVPAKTAVKQSGAWKAVEAVITLTSKTGQEEYRLEDGLWMGTNTYLIKFFVTNPAFQTKYAGTYHLLYSGEDKASDFTETITLKADGKCSRSTPVADRNGAITPTPTLLPGTWKANEGIIQLIFTQEGVEQTTEYTLKEGVFSDRSDNTLKKIVPPGTYLTKYAGTYHMIGEGQNPTAKSDKYVLKVDGTGTWTYFGSAGAPVVVKGTWKASEGLIQLAFIPEDGGELLTDFKLREGVFRAEGVVLKKVVQK